MASGLGGGVGHLTRKCGLTIDNFLEVDVVLADGTFVTANADEHPDLFWAIRGGGGNFGVVTSFTLQLHDVSNVWAGPMLWPLDRTEDVLPFFHEFIGTAPEDLNGFFAFMTVPPAPPFPEELHLKKMCGIVWCYAGPADQVDALLAPARALGGIALDGVMELPYPGLEQRVRCAVPQGLPVVLACRLRPRHPRGGGEAARSSSAPSSPPCTPPCTSIPWTALLRASPTTRPRGPIAMPGTRRSSSVSIPIRPMPKRSRAGRIDYFDALHPYSMGGAYVNFMMDEGQERVQATYRDNYDRLSQIKGRYDPTNLFHVNQNIQPSR